MDDFAEEVHIVHIQGYQFADPHSGAVEDFKDGSVACAQASISRGGVQQANDLFVFEEFGEFFVLFGGLDGHHGIAADAIPLDEKFVEAAKRRQLASRGGFGVMIFAQLDHVAADGVDIGGDDRRVEIDRCLGLCRSGCGSGVFPRVCRRGRSVLCASVLISQECCKLYQICPVALGGML
jgi:hypothetical protein